MASKILKQFAIGKVEPKAVVEEMQESYLDYAMSVIVARALPDVRDGFKPVHRRILYAMGEMGLRSSGKHRKSASVVGEVLGKYHPHGDVAVYDSMVRMAQDFSMRYCLVDGQGNFGSVDGDPAAAMRYTECRMTKLAEEALADIDKETVDFRPNYDDTRKEPTVLPAKIPHLLLNGTVGIAVGMASSIPPHNLSEICDALIFLIDHPEGSVEELMKYVKGPDLPTGGIIFNKKDILQAYLTGKGRFVMRAIAEIVEEEKGAPQIVVSEIPFMVNKTVLLERIAELVRDKKIEGIKDLRDESNKDGIRVVIDLKKDSYPNKILNQLYQLTSLQDVFYINMLALVDGIQPKVLNLKMILEEFLKHRHEVVVRRARFELTRAEDRAHILEGLQIALNKIDAVITLIRRSKDKDEAKVNLMKQFRLSEKQSIAILEMRLQNLANLERLKIDTELQEKMALIFELKALLASPKKIFKVIQTELDEIKEKYGDERKTKIIAHEVDTFSMEDLIPDESTIIIITQDGYIKRLPQDVFKTQGRGGKGVLGLTTKEEDIVEHFFATTTHSNLLFFTTTGRVFQLRAYDVPQSSRTTKGQALVNFLQLGMGESVSSVLSLGELGEHRFLVMATKDGVIKKVPLEELSHVRRSGLIAIRLRNGDRLQWVKPSSGKDQLVLVSQNGQAIRFSEKDVRPMGRVATGVRGMRLKGDDAMVGMAVVSQTSSIKACHVITVMENGFGKRSVLEHYKEQKRGGMGIRTAKITARTGHIVWANAIQSEDKHEQDMIIISGNGQVIRLPFRSVPILGRDTQGVKLMSFRETDDHVASVTLISSS